MDCCAALSRTALVLVLVWTTTAANGVRSQEVGLQSKPVSHLHDLTSAQRIVTWDGGHGEASTVAFSPNGKWFASGGSDATVCLWDLSGGKPREVASFVAGRSWVRKLAFSSDCRRLAVADALSPQVLLIDLASPKPSASMFRVSAETSVNLAFSVDGNFIATTAGTDMDVRLWDIREPAPKLAKRLVGYIDGVGLVAFTPDGKSLLTQSNAGLWRIQEVWLVWDLTGPKPESRKYVKRSPDGAVYTDWIAITGDSSVVIECDLTMVDRVEGSVASDLTVTKRNLATGKVASEVRLRGAGGRIVSAAFSPDLASLVSVDSNGLLVWWDIQRGRQLKSLPLKSKVRHVAFAPDGQHVATACTDGSLAIIRLVDG
jgi:WD40 repeat protein